jgi:hypothetical protein
MDQPSINPGNGATHRSPALRLLANTIFPRNLAAAARR